MPRILQLSARGIRPRARTPVSARCPGPRRIDPNVIRMRIRPTLFALALLLVAGALAPKGAVAQNVTQAQADRLLATTPESEIIARLQASGMSRAQVRARLNTLGLDPSMADRYFDAMAAGESLDGSADDGVVSAMRDIGVLLRTDTADLAPPEPRMSAASGSGAPELFGRALFRNRGSLFDPIQTGAVGSDYELGPGDEILLVLTGDVELGYTLDVNREGLIVIPDVGQVSVAGRTLAELEDALYARLGARYSTLTRSPNASTRFSVSLGRLRTISVFVSGEVETPGRYPVSSVATLLEAMYAAGGPTSKGSLRSIRIDRGGEPVGVVDLYPYLTSGNRGADIRLRQGDFVYVPPAETLVTISGAVRRPAIFELRDGEGVPDLVRFAGGLEPDAATDRAGVRRVLPPSMRTPGMDRVVVDLPLAAAMADTPFQLFAGDDIEVFSVLDDLRSTLSIDGAVWRPGEYEFASGMTVASLIAQAGGTPPDVYPSRVLISRLDPITGRRSAIRTTLADAAGTSLREFDEVTLFAIDELLEPDSVAVFGNVANPGRYPLREGMTAEDLILLAGGFRRGAIPWEAAVAMPERGATVSDILATVERVALSPSLPYPDSTLIWPDVREVPETLASALPLGADFEVYVSQLPGFRYAERVVVDGEVAIPGSYALETLNERLSTVLERAGGPTGRAYLEAARLERDELPIGVDFEEAISNPGSDADPIVQSGDRIVVPQYDPTVRVEGEVQFQSLIQYREGMSLDDVIQEAGGLTREGDGGRISITYANGRRSTVHRKLLFFSSKPEVRPGSVVSVPTAPEQDPFDFDAWLSRTLAIISTFATVYVAVGR